MCKNTIYNIKLTHVHFPVLKCDLKHVLCSDVFESIALVLLQKIVMLAPLFALVC